MLIILCSIWYGIAMQEKKVQSTNDPKKGFDDDIVWKKRGKPLYEKKLKRELTPEEEKKYKDEWSIFAKTRDGQWEMYGKPTYEKRLGRELTPEEEKKYKDEWIDQCFSEEEEGKEVNREKVIKSLERTVGKEMDEELKQLLNIPPSLYKDRGNTYVAFSKDEKPGSASTTRYFFMPFFVARGLTPVPSKEHYVIMISETTSQGYITFFDGSRRVAVKALVYSYYDEDVRGWKELKEGLKRALEAVKEEPENIIIAYESGIKKFDITKKELL